MRRWQKVMVSLLLMLALACGAFLWWANDIAHPTEQLEDLVTQTPTYLDNKHIVYSAPNSTTAIVLYPGAKVDPAAYSYYAQQLAQQGYSVIIAKMRLNLALLDINIATFITEQFDDIETWYMAGHSLGGVAAAAYAEQQDNIEGLIFLGSYPSGDLTASDLRVLSLYAQYDGLTTLADIEASKNNLPPTAQFVEIKGGNHAQFGLYGEQKGDLHATISAQQQQEQMITETVKWLKE